MLFVLRHPGLAKIRCEDCKRWIVNVKREEFTERGGKRQRRLPTQPTPCRYCPKGSPAEAREIELTHALRKTIELYVRSKATFGRYLNEQEAADPIVARHFAVIDSVLHGFDKTDTAQQMAESLMLASPVRRSKK